MLVVGTEKCHCTSVPSLTNGCAPEIDSPHTEILAELPAGIVLLTPRLAPEYPVDVHATRAPRDDPSGPVSVVITAPVIGLQFTDPWSDHRCLFWREDSTLSPCPLPALRARQASAPIPDSTIDVDV